MVISFREQLIKSCLRVGEFGHTILSMVHAFYLSSPLSLKEYAAISDSTFPWHAISSDWFGNKTRVICEYRLFLDPSSLFFHARANRKPKTKPDATQGSFIEGLWEYDLAELFICEENSPRYLEVNLGPQAAWWSCLFKSYRERSGAPSALKEAHTISEITETGWNAGILIPRASFPFLVRDQGFRANVTFIIDDNGPVYFSASKLTSEAPDYHVAEQFPSVAIERRN